MGFSFGCFGHSVKNNEVDYEQTTIIILAGLCWVIACEIVIGLDK
tara:strand:+ start:586 stop:720 length:135 start_codon:yes stop_codon:yes gene_type:complete